MSDPDPRDSALNLDTIPQSSRSPTGPESTPNPNRPPHDPLSGYGAGYGSGLGERHHLREYLRILHKRRWTLLTSFAVVMTGVTVYTFTATPVYEASVQVLIENQEQNVVQFQQVLDENRSTNDYYQTQYRILESRALARRTLQAEDLWNHPLFLADSGSGDLDAFRPASWPAAAAAIGDLINREQPVESAAKSETVAQSAAINRFLRGLSVAPVRNSRLVEVTYSSPDPAMSARLANALARQYIDQNLEFKFLATQEATKFLSARMAEQRKSLEVSEQALQKYREQTGAVALEDRQNIVVQRLADLNAAVTRARTERIEKEAVYNQIRTVQSSRSDLDTTPAILSNSFIQQLKAQVSDLQRQQAQLAEKLGPRHPEMVKVQTAIDSLDTRITAEVQKVVEALRSDYQTALSNERALMVSLEQQRAEAQELNRASIQYGVLERDTATNRQMFEGLLQRSKETDIAGELKTNNIRIVDEAEEPQEPARPNRTYNLSIGFLGGALLGVGLAFFFEYLDSRIKNPEEIRAQLGLPYLGLIPSIPPRELTGAPLIANGVPPHFSEAVRAIRTNVLFSSADEGPKVVVVTSTGPGEGKTVVSTNLAMAIASSGRRVLLIDGDMRRPKVHEFFTSSLEPGLSNVMVGESKASEAVRATPTQNLWMLPAGKHPPNPAELLGSRRFHDFVTSLGHHFDWILIDSPPVMAVTDAAIIGHQANGVVFVVGAEMTNVGEARAALDQLDGAKVKYVGAVLNKVDLRRNSYYYSHYFKRAYGAYYHKHTA